MGKPAPLMIRAVAATRKIVAMDVVELLPQPGDHASDFLAAKLIYRALGYIFPGGDANKER